MAASVAAVRDDTHTIPVQQSSLPLAIRRTKCATPAKRATRLVTRAASVVALYHISPRNSSRKQLRVRIRQANSCVSGFVQRTAACQDSSREQLGVRILSENIERLIGHPSLTRWHL